MSYKDTEGGPRQNPVERLALLIKFHNEEGNKTSGIIWHQLRQAILARDDYTCQDCGGKANTVHHTTYGIITSRDLVSLCCECHIRRHGLNPELISRQTREIHDMGEAIELIPKRIAELKSELEGYDNHWFLPYMLPREKWEKYRRPYLVNVIDEMVNELSSLRIEYEMVKAERKR